MAKHYDFIFFLLKTCMTSKLRQNAAVNEQNNSNKTISTIFTFYQKKKNTSK